MILLGGFRETQDQGSAQRNEASASPDASCLRCGGLMIQDYGASREWKDRGLTVTSLRCVNCGNRLDLDILANRGKPLLPPRPNTRRARPPKGPL